MASQLQNSPLASWKIFTNWITEPASSMKDSLEREQSRLLTSTLLVFLLTTLLLLIVRFVSHGVHQDVDLIGRAVIAVFTAVAIFFSHRGYTRSISLISIGFGALVIFYFALYGDDVAGLTTLNYLVCLIIFGSLFLPLWLNALILFLQLTGILIFAWWLPGASLPAILSGPFSFLLTLGVIALVITHYRNNFEDARKTTIALSEKRFRGIFETSPLGIRLYGANGTFQSANPTCLNNFGPLQGFSELSTNLFADSLVSEEIKQQLHAGERVRFTHKLELKNALVSEEASYQDVSITPLREEGQIQGYLMQLVDISEQKRVEEIIRARRNNLLLISDNLPAMVAHIDTHQHYIFTNRPYAEFFKRSEKNIIGYRLDEVVGVEIAERLSAATRRVLAGERVEFEIALLDPNADLRLMQGIFVPDLDSSGQLCAYVAMFIDITERKKAEANLAHKAAQLELLNHIGKHLSVITSTSEVLNRAVHLVEQTFHYNGVSIFLEDEDLKDLVLMAKAGDYAEAFPEDLHVHFETGIVGWVASRGETRLSNDVSADPVYVNPYAESAPTQAELCVPILIDGHVIGVIDLQSPQLNAFDDGDVLVMQTMAEQIGISIENAQLHTASNQQIEERKRTEELLQTALRDKEALLREVHHRVKNNMQVIASMLNLRAEKVTDPRALQAFQDCQNSISAIASVHKSLYESSGLALINADEYIPNLIERLKASSYDMSSQISHQIAIDPVNFDFDAAIPCGLILNELLTNVYKYAFPPDRQREPTCKVDVSLFEKDAKICLIVRDNGIGFPEDFDDRKSQALGLQLTELLVKQLKGVLTMSGGDGVAVEVVFPSPRLKSGGSNVTSTNSGGR